MNQASRTRTGQPGAVSMPGPGAAVSGGQSAAVWRGLLARGWARETAVLLAYLAAGIAFTGLGPPT